MDYATINRAMLGFGRKCGHLSLADTPLDVSSVDWDLVSRDWGQTAIDGLSFLPIPIDLKSSLFICRGRLRLHTDVVDYGTASVGLITDCAEDFALITHGNRINAAPGDIFILDPHKKHGAETASDFLFLVLDVPIVSLEQANEYARIFKEDLRQIADHQKASAAAPATELKMQEPS